jgi:Lar family restriction alleviation protein
MSIEPKPCPFCGCEKIEVGEMLWNEKYKAFCSNCRTSRGQSMKATKEKAIEAWNERAGEDKP